MATAYSTIIYRLIIASIIFVLIDLYVFKAFKTIIAESTPVKKNVVTYLYWGINITLMVLIISVFVFFQPSKGANQYFYFLAGMVILFLVPKLIIMIIMMMEDVFRLIRAGVVGVGKMIGTDNLKDIAFFESRKRFVSQVAVGIASIPFFAILHGITRGKYNYTIHRVNLKFRDLPDAFHGFTITQLSDIHSGSYNNPEEVKRGIDLVNEQGSDLFLFTGDLVNNVATEMDDWIDTFKEVKASYGKFSIFGNHDYGDYIQWPNAAAKRENIESLKKVHDQLGFRLMLNESIEIKKGEDKIILTGVENWGKPPFPQYGDLDKASAEIDNKNFKILMSHDPSHFDAIVKDHDIHYHLTLSGHTHGFQFGVEIPGIKWSPVQYRYPKWAGLYQENSRYLYVNRGFGFLGFPGRVGIWPEITVITLEKA